MQIATLTAAEPAGFSEYNVIFPVIVLRAVFDETARAGIASADV
jgi:hypothetical protein